MNIIERADKYADGKANDAITKAIAKAYMDGYRDGYNDREAEIPVDFRNNKTTYVDLGLPSRTLWSTDYEKDDNDIMLYLPYERADYLKIPTAEQWKELYSCCRWEPTYYNHGRLSLVKCIGPNGNIIQFTKTGRKNADIISNDYEAFFWLELNENKNQSAHIDSWDKGWQWKITDMFSGYHLPVRLVR